MRLFIKPMTMGLVSGGYGNGWLFGYSNNRSQAGNYEIIQNGMQDIGFFGPADNSGIIYVGGHDGIFDKSSNFTVWKSGHRDIPAGI